VLNCLSSCRYREILNQCQLFHERCHFDIERRKQYDPSADKIGSRTSILQQSLKSPKSSVMEKDYAKLLFGVPPQVYVRCNFCNQSLAHNSLFIPGVGMIGYVSRFIYQYNLWASFCNKFLAYRYLTIHRMLGNDLRKSNLVESTVASTVPSTLQSVAPSPTSFSHESVHGTGTAASSITGARNAILHPSQRTKSIACPSCRKPLPRCAICLLHMGTPMDWIEWNVEEIDLDLQKRTEEECRLDAWFTWCQMCRYLHVFFFIFGKSIVDSRHFFVISLLIISLYLAVVSDCIFS
jgi:hypothetical protein